MSGVWTEEYTPPPLTESRARSRTARFLSADEISLVAPRMLVRGQIPAAAITLLASAPGAGKGVLLTDYIARGSRGEMMPNGDRITRPFSTIIVATPGEDGPTDWRLRLHAANADQTRYRIVDEVIDEIGFAHPVKAADLSAILHRAAVDGFDLVVVDSLGGIAGDINLDKVEVRDKLLGPLAMQARTLDLAVVLVHHTRKTGGTLLEIISGSQQIAAACRSVMAVVEERESDTRARFLAVAKLNGSKASAPIAFTTSGKSITVDGGALRDDRGDLVFVPVVVWSDRTVTDAELNAASNNMVVQRDEVADILRELLAGGPVRSSALEAELAEAGFSKDQVKRSRQRIGAGVVKIGFGPNAGWWTLPPGMPKPEGRALIDQAVGAS